MEFEGGLAVLISCVTPCVQYCLLVGIKTVSMLNKPYETPKSAVWASTLVGNVCEIWLEAALYGPGAYKLESGFEVDDVNFV